MKYLFNKIAAAYACCLLFSACGSSDDHTMKSDGKENNNINVTGEVTTKAELQKIVSSNKNVLVDFYADWCGPCKQMEPAIANITRQYEGTVVVLRINVDKAEELSKDMGIQAIPYLVFYKDGAVKNELEGYQREEVLQQNIATIFK